MAEMRMTTVIGTVVVVGAVGLTGAAFMDWVSIGPLNRKNIVGLFDSGAAQVTGFTPAKTPQEAMDKFRQATEERKYTYAARYVTKDYAAMLLRANEGAVELGGAIDRVRDYSKNKGTDTDKVTFMLHLLDPFPKMLKSGPAPVQKGDKYYGQYVVTLPTMTTSREKLLQEMGNVDYRMFQSVLAPRLIFENPIEIVKEGEEWKLNVPTNPPWEGEVGYFQDNWRTYFTALDTFKGWIINNRAEISTPQGMETEVIEVLRKAKKNR